MRKLYISAPVILLICALEVSPQDASWETVSIPGICTYQIPPTLEVQKGTYKKFTDQLRKTVFEITTSADRVVAQPKGINDFDPAALKRYCRVIVETEWGQSGDFFKLNEPLWVPFFTDELPAVEARAPQLWRPNWIGRTWPGSRQLASSRSSRVQNGGTRRRP